MRLRFITCHDPLSWLIRDRGGQMVKAIGFTPSHVEMVVSEGYLGAHDDGGVQVRPVGYDAARLLLLHDGNPAELFVDVPLSAAGDRAAETWARNLIGTPYDWGAVLGFLVPFNMNEHKHLICSAFMAATLKVGGAFKYPLARAPHAIAPADLLFLLSGIMPIPQLIEAAS
jgi:hypothetical protein